MCVLLLVAVMVIAARDGRADTAESDLESRLAQRVEFHIDRSLPLLKKVVNINSDTMNIGGVRKVGRIFNRELKQLGMTTRWIDMRARKRAGHLFAQTTGESGKCVLLVSHLDTVYPRGTDFRRFKQNSDFVEGPGVVDAKGGIVALLVALKALNEIVGLDQMRLAVALMGDEERIGRPPGKTPGLAGCFLVQDLPVRPPQETVWG